MNSINRSENICLDMDGVLADTVTSVLAHNNNQFAGKQLEYNDVIHHNFHQIPGFEHSTKDQAIEIFQTFLIDAQLHSQIKPLDSAFEALSYLKDQGHKLYVVTARPQSLKKLSYDRLALNIPVNFEDIICIDHQMMTGDITKSSICKSLSSTIMVEDAPHNAIDLADNGIYTFLMKQPWNKIWLAENADYKNIQAVLSWEEVG